MLKLKKLLKGILSCLLIGSLLPTGNVFAQEENVLNLAVGSEPPSINPALGVDTVSGAIIRNVFERLTRLDVEAKPHPAAAESWEMSEDGLTYQFHLREDALWSDGSPVTAHDFEFAWETVLNPDTLAQSAALFYVIEGAESYNTGEGSVEDVAITVVDDYTLEVSLTKPVPYFLDLISGQSFSPVPKVIAETNPDWASDVSETYVTNGPFLLTEWVHSGHLLLEANPYYWDSENVHLDTVNIQVVDSQSTANIMFQAGELDYIGTPFTYVSLDAIDQYQADGLLNIQDLGSVYYYTVNINDDIMSNVNIRKALALAIDRQALIDNVLKGGETPAMGLVPISTAGFEDKTDYFSDKDVDGAKTYLTQGLEELGLSEANELTISLSYNTSEAHAAVAQFIQNNWIQNLGINVTLENTEWQVHLDNLAAQNYQVARLGWYSEYNDGSSLLSMYRTTSAGNNYTGWESEAYRALLDQADNELDQAKRIDLLKEAEALFINDMPIIPIYYYSNPYVVQENVVDMAPDTLGNVDLKSVDKIKE